MPTTGFRRIGIPPNQTVAGSKAGLREGSASLLHVVKFGIDMFMACGSNLDRERRFTIFCMQHFASIFTPLAHGCHAEPLNPAVFTANTSYPVSELQPLLHIVVGSTAASFG